MRASIQSGSMHLAGAMPAAWNSSGWQHVARVIPARGGHVAQVQQQVHGRRVRQRGQGVAGGGQFLHAAGDLAVGLTKLTTTRSVRPERPAHSRPKVARCQSGGVFP